jgi:hypothetical protein
VNIRRVMLDVDWAFAGPGIEAVAAAIDGVPGVEGANLTVTEIDLETIGTDVAVEGQEIDLRRLVAAIERTGAVVHSIDELAIGERVVEHVRRVR